MFKEFSLGFLVVASSLVEKKGKLAEMVTRCHSLCYSLSLDVLLVCLFINDPVIRSAFS